MTEITRTQCNVYFQCDQPFTAPAECLIVALNEKNKYNTKNWQVNKIDLIWHTGSKHTDAMTYTIYLSKRNDNGKIVQPTLTFEKRKLRYGDVLMLDERLITNDFNHLH